MRTLLPLGIVISLAGPLGCGPAPEPVSPKPQADDRSVAPSQVAGQAAFDLSPVPEPANIVGLVRWSNPSATLSALTGCAGLPPQLAEGNVRALVEEILGDALRGSADKKQLGAVVALDAPVHVVAALDASGRRSAPIAAISLGLVSLERAKGAVEATGPLTELMPGVWKIGGKERSPATCVIAASAGSTPARLICGERDKDLVALGPYLARTLPTVAPGGRDLHAEIRFVPLSDKFGAQARQQLRGLGIIAQSELSIGEPRFDKAIVEAANGVQDELSALIGDADKATFDLGVDPRSCLSLSSAVELRGKSSWLAGAISDGSDRAASPPPPIFWRLPKKTDAAFFARGADPARYSTILRTLRTLLEGFLTKENVGKPADRKALADLLSMPLGKDTSSVSASGHGDTPPAKPGTSNAQQTLDQMVGNWVGWSLVGVDEGPETMTKYLKDLVAVYNRPALLGALRKELGEDGKLLPTVKTVPAPKELGKGSLAVEIKFTNLPAPGERSAPPGAKGRPAKPQTISFSIHALLMGEEKTTWVAVGADKAELVKQLSMVKTGAPDAGTLASRPGLEPLKSGKLVSGGFITLAPMTRAFSAGMSFFTQFSGPGGSPPEVQQIMNTLNNLPHKAEGPIFFTGQSRGGNAPRAELSLNLSKPVLEDVGALVMAGLKLANALNP